MKKLFILFLVFTLTGCASRKVAINKSEEVIKSDSISIEKKDSVSTIKNNIKIVENYEEVEITPEVCGVEMVVNGISYKNAVLRYKKSKKEHTDTSTKIVSKKASKQVLEKKQENKITKNKTTDKKANNFVYFWLLLIPAGMYIYRQIKNKLFL